MLETRQEMLGAKTKAKAPAPKMVIASPAGKPSSAALPTGSSSVIPAAVVTAIPSQRDVLPSMSEKKGSKKKKGQTSRGGTPPSSQRKSEEQDGSSSTFAPRATSAYEVVATKPPLVRAAVETTSAEVGKVPSGTKVYVLEMLEQPDGAKRACIALEGSQKPHGWLTAVTKDGVENLRKLPLPVYEVLASKPPLVRAGFELNSDKVAGVDLTKGTRVHVLETRTMPDGAHRACIAPEGSEAPHGWVTSVTKDGIENIREVQASGGSSGSSKEVASTSAFGGRLPIPARIVALKPPLVRAAAETTSEKKGELPCGSSVIFLEMRAQPDGSKRACIALEGADQPHGWLTAVTKDGVENLRLVIHEVSATKPPLVRSAAETTSEKVGELAIGTRVHVIETRTMPDGSKRACIILQQPQQQQPQQQQPYGWVTSVSKEGTANLRLLDTLPDPAANAAVKVPATPRPLSVSPTALTASTARLIPKTYRGGKPMSAEDAAAAEARAAARKQAKAEQRALEEMVKFQKEAEKKAKTLAVKEEEKRRMDAIRQDKERAANEARLRAQKRKEEELAAAKEAERLQAEKAMREAKAARAAVEAKKGQRGAGPHVAIATAEDLASRFKTINAQAHATLDPAYKEAFKALKEADKLISEVEPTRRNEAHRPHGRPDGALSRHIDVPPQSLMLMFNCFRAEYKLELGDISTVPDAEDVPIKALASLVTIGRLKISPDKGTPFMERIEFPNQVDPLTNTFYPSA